MRGGGRASSHPYVTGTPSESQAGGSEEPCSTTLSVERVQKHAGSQGDRLKGPRKPVSSSSAAAAGRPGPAARDRWRDLVAEPDGNLVAEPDGPGPTEQFLPERINEAWSCEP